MKKFAAIAVYTGSRFDFIYGWLGTGLLLAGPPTLLSAFMV